MMRDQERERRNERGIVSGLLKVFNDETGGKRTYCFSAAILGDKNQGNASVDRFGVLGRPAAASRCVHSA